MLFCDRLSEIDSDPTFQASRHKLVGYLLARFAESFPTVAFQPELSLRIINAQAVTASAGRLVKLYGGLAFHPSLDFHSLTLILLHEVGHHLSPGCRSPFDVTLACECEADHWSVTEGLDALNAASNRPLKVQEAIERLDHLFSRVEDETEKRLSKCWSAHWPGRRDALLKKTRCPRFCTT
jgi:hypothetical protein